MNEKDWTIMQQKALKAFEECCKVVSTLERIGMGTEWTEDTKSGRTEDTKSVIVATKQYLKMEYKVSYFIPSFSHLLISPLKIHASFPPHS